MLAIAQSAVLLGIASHPVRVEVNVMRGVPAFELVGLAETAVRESRVRVKSALAGLGVDIAEHRITVNLAPADVRKSGSAFDLAIALGVLVGLDKLAPEALKGVLLVGELSLNGTIQSLRGVVAHLVGARKRGILRAIVPALNEHEASLVDGIEIELAATLGDVVQTLRGEHALPAPKPSAVHDVRSPTDDLADVRGQHGARRALEIAAAGQHNLIMMGPPGAGKTMLARRLPGILPPLSREERLEVMAIHGVAGLLGPQTHLLGERPFRAPHHTISDAALVGGGDNVRPGEVSLAHHGVLFLDELAELRRPALEALRQPLEDGAVMVCRMRTTVTYPARPLLIAATNPCPCGNRGDGTDRCFCSPEAIRLYRRRLSGPLLDRIDIHVVLPRVDPLSLQGGERGESSLRVRSRVEHARAIQLSRFRKKVTSVPLNAHLSPADLERVCVIDANSRPLLAAAMRQRGLSARAYAKVLRVARTIADLAACEDITVAHVSEALAGRVLDRDTEERAAA